MTSLNKSLFTLLVLVLGIQYNLASQASEDFGAYSQWLSEYQETDLIRAKAGLAKATGMSIGPIAAGVLAFNDNMEAAIGVGLASLFVVYFGSRREVSAKVQLSRLTAVGRRNDWLNGFKHPVNTQGEVQQAISRTRDRLDLKERLELLKSLLDEGLITNEEYEALRKEALEID